jgi:hypothetical protein
MADVNDVLERLVSDPGFRRALSDDPDRALEGYDLTDADREMLAAQVSEDAGVGGGLEQRTSKSALAGLFGTGGGSGQSDLDFLSRHAEHGDGDAPLEEEIGFAYKKISFDEGESLISPPKDPADLQGEEPPTEDISFVYQKVEWDDQETLVGAAGEPEAPSDLSTGAETEAPPGVDGTVGGQTHAGKYIVTSVQHAASPSDEGEPLASSPANAPDGEGGDVPIEGMSLNFGNVGEGDGEALAAPASDPVGQDSHEIVMDVHVGRSEPEAPSDMSAGDQTEDSSSGWPSKWEGPGLAADPAAGDAPASLAVDGMVGGKTDASLPEDGGSTAEGESGATSNKPKEIVVVSSKPPAGAEAGDLAEASVRGEETEDETLKTVAASDSTSEAKGDPLVGKITPKGETEQGSPTLKEAIFQNTYPGDTAPGHEEEIEVLSFNPGTAGDPDQPIITGRVYNTDDPTEEAAGIELGAMKAGSTEALDADESLTAQDDEAAGFLPDGTPLRAQSDARSTGAGLRSDGELVQGDDTGPGDLAPAGRGAEEGIEGTDVSTGYTSEPGDIGDDLPDDPPED